MTDSANGPATDNASSFRLVEISREPIELFKVLKFEGLADSGGQAKAAVAAGAVLVNGRVEIRKRKKLVSGDTIEYNQQRIRLEIINAPTPIETNETPEMPEFPETIKTPDTKTENVPNEGPKK